MKWALFQFPSWHPICLGREQGTEVREPGKKCECGSLIWCHGGDMVIKGNMSKVGVAPFNSSSMMR